MAGGLLVGIVGDRDPARPTHAATEASLHHAADALGLTVETTWLATDALERDGAAKAREFDAIWCAPGSPYRSPEGALEGIRVAREEGKPFIGTCGGFQHAMIEFARNALGIADAGHAEYDPDSPKPFISALTCSPFGQAMNVEASPGSLVAASYGGLRFEEEYRCNFGLAPERRKLLQDAGLRVVGVDDEGEARILELADHPFYVATLFVPQIKSAREAPHPLIVALLEAALDARSLPKTGSREGRLRQGP